MQLSSCFVDLHTRSHPELLVVYITQNISALVQMHVCQNPFSMLRSLCVSKFKLLTEVTFVCLCACYPASLNADRVSPAFKGGGGQGGGSWQRATPRKESDSVVRQGL